MSDVTVLPTTDSPGGAGAPLHVGYVLKQYPRLSETFVLNEILGVEATGTPASVFSLRHATEGRFHPGVAAVKAKVHYPPTTDRAAFADALRALAGFRTERLADVIAFCDLLPSDRHAKLLLGAIAVAEQTTAAGVTHLHAHFLTVAAQTAHIVHLLTGLPYTITAHAKDIYRHTVDWQLAARIAGSAAAVVTVCDANLTYLAHRLDGSGTRLRRIYNGLGPQEAPVGLGGRQRELVLGVGRLVEKKGFDTFLDTVAELAATRPSLRAVLVGDGDDRPGLEARAAALGIADRVSFTGALGQHEVATWMRRAHVMLAPCKVGDDGNQDALPTVLVEALGAGLPSVTTPVAGIPEIVTDGVEGCIVAPGDVAATTRAVVDLLDDDDRWTAMSNVGPLKLAARFDRSTSIEQLLEAFRGQGVTVA